jgi:hypothetical protein
MMCVTLVRQTARAWLARAAQARLHGAPQLSADQRARLATPLTAALAAYHRIAHQSRRLTQGHVETHRPIGNAYEPTIAPIGTGKCHGAAPCGRQPGMLAEPAAGFIVPLHVPVGHPRDVSDVQPVVDQVQQASARITTSPRPALSSLAGARRCPSRGCSPWGARIRSIPSPHLAKDRSCL